MYSHITRFSNSQIIIMKTKQAISWESLFMVAFVCQLSGHIVAFAQNPSAPPEILIQPQSQTANEGANIVLSVTAADSLSLTYQWQSNGDPIASATLPNLNLNNVRSTNAGLYCVAINNAFGTITSADAQLSVIPAAVGAGSTDLDFYPRQATDDPVYAVAVQQDGKVLIGGRSGGQYGPNQSYLARLNTDGSLDTTFNPVIASGDIRCIILRIDGTILIGGNFNTIGGVSRNCIACLNADGSLNTEFDPRGINTPLDPRGAIPYAIRAMTIQADGKLLVAGDGWGNNSIFPRGYAGIVRLNPDGGVDPSFNAGIIGEQVWILYPNGPDFAGLPEYLEGWVSPDIHSVRLEANGKILVGGRYSFITEQMIGPGLPGLSRWDFGYGLLARLNPDGSVDPDFRPSLDLFGPWSWTDATWPVPGVCVSAIDLQEDGTPLILESGVKTHTGG
jgi:uncharacterized delta-60 repeat protein